jgi:hypothetical protein
VRLEAVNIVGAVFWIVNKGYDREYRIKDDHLFDLALNCPLDPRGIHVGTALRLESRPNAGDASVVYAILDQKTLSKGLLIDVFDIFDEICDRGYWGPLVRLFGRYFVIAVSTSKFPCNGREVIGISRTVPIFEAIEGARAARPLSSTKGRRRRIARLIVSPANSRSATRQRFRSRRRDAERSRSEW